MGPIDPALVADPLVTDKPLLNSEVPLSYEPKLWEGVACLLADQNRVYKPKPSDKSPEYATLLSIDGANDMFFQKPCWQRLGRKS